MNKLIFIDSEADNKNDGTNNFINKAQNDPNLACYVGISYTNKRHL